MSLRDYEIVILDEDFALINQVKKILGNLGANIVSTCDVDECVKIIDEIQPHLLLLDLQLQKGKGFDFLEEKGSWIKSLGTKIIIFSFNDQKELEGMVLSYGIDDYIQKPLNSAVLIKKAKKNLETGDTLECLFEKGFDVEIELKGEIVSFNEFELVLNGPVRIEKDVHVKIHSSFLKSFKMPSMKFLSRGRSSYIKRGLFKNVLDIIGTKDDFLKKIQKYKNTK